MNTAIRNYKGPIFCSLLALFWAAGSIPLIRGEWQAMRTVPHLVKLEFDDKKFAVDGPIYILAKVAQDRIPSDRTLCFLNPSSGAEGDYYSLKMKYYLWPRKMVIFMPGDSLTLDEILKADFILLFNRRGAPNKAREALKQLPFLKQVFEFDQGETYHAIYQNQNR